ncbi:MAG: hypothetical protein R2939_21885 [Kofleriaceae bacterium]
MYTRRLTSISKKLEDTIQAASALETELEQLAKKGEKFTFFM